MYGVQNVAALLRARRGVTAGRTARTSVSSTVVLLGMTSLLTDISAEMVATTLPIYLVASLGFTPLMYGVIDGLQTGAATIVSLGSGVISDRTRRYKEVAAAGYGFGAISKLMLALVGTTFAAIGAAVAIDRVGKGLRTAPRDALIALSTPDRDLGLAFGVHRAMDTIGALIGPLVAFAILMIAPGAYQSVFVVSFLIAVVGVAVIALFVRNPKRPDTPPEPPSLRASAGVLTQPRYRALLVIAGALAFVTVSDAFVYLLVYRSSDLDAQYFPLLYTGSAIVFMLLAVPFGRLADAVGRRAVFLGGYVLRLIMYGILVLGVDSSWSVIAVLVLLGASYAATDGVVAALVSGELPPQLRGSGLGFLQTVTSGCALLASLAFGALWAATDERVATIVFASGLMVALVAGAIFFARGERQVA